MATPVSSKKNVRVLYDYNYEEKDGRHVTIKSGDECILVKKTDDDWWLVLRCGEKKGIYVPANYLQEIHMTTVVVGGGATVPPKVKPKPAKPPPIPKKPKPPLVEDDVLKEFDNMLDHALDGDSSEPQPDYDDDDETQKKCDKNTGEEAVEDDGDYINVPNIKSRTDATKARTDANANKVKREILENYENIPFKSERSSDAVDDREPEPDYENMSTELPQYANLEVIQESIRRRSKMSDSEGPEQPKEGAMADRVLVGGWEQHCGEAGRMFYFNPVTKQSQWEPPSDSDEDRLSVSSRHSLRRMTSMPPGWTEEQCDSGDVFFINDVTKERWQSSVDMSGRIYYFRENSSGESSWVLPEACPVATPRSVSLRINLTTARSLLTNLRWRRSSWSSGGRQHVVTPPRVLAVAPPRVSNTYILNASTPTEPEGGDTLPTGGRPETDGASASSSPRNSPDGSTEANSNRPLATRLKEYKGSLYKKKLLENNRKLKKNWAQCYVVTTGQMLYFYKDQKATNAKPNQPMGKPEVTIDLRDAEIIYTSEVVLARKNIIIVKTRSGTDEYMLQHDKSEEIHVWNQTLKGNIESLAKYSGRPTTLTLPHQRSVDTLPGSDHHSPVTESANTTLPRKKASPRDRMTGTATLERTNNTGKLYITDDADGTRRIKDWLTNWFKKRPPVETLRAKGIIQDAVFGSHLMSLYIKEDGKVPHFVMGCIAAIEDRGLTIDGIYRVSGNLAEIQKLKFCVNQDSDLDLVKSEFDLHVLTGALKMFFRELKEPLFPFNTFDKFMNAIKMPNKSMKTQLFRDLIKVLPPYSKDTMRTLFEHLLRVINCSKENRMQIQNIAIVFGPTLLWPEQPAENVAMTLVLQNQIVDFILHEYKKLF